MRQCHYITLALLVSALFGCQESNSSASTEPVDLAITLAPIHHQQGALYVQLSDANQTLESQWRLASETDQPIVFSNVAPGEYAVFAFHDLDGDKLLSFKDNIPVEPMGYSNNPTLRGEPPFGLVSFDLRENQTLELTLFSYP